VYVWRRPGTRMSVGAAVATCMIMVWWVLETPFIKIMNVNKASVGL